MPGWSTTEKSTKAAKVLVQIMMNPGPNAPFAIGEIQLHAIDRLSTLFKKVQPNKPNRKVVPR